MSGPSTRYAPHIALCCALALIPVGVHAYLGLRSDECARPGTFAPEHAGLSRGQERTQYMLRNFDATQWREGRVPRDGGAPELRYSIVRSYDAKRVYHRPYNVFLRDETPVSQRIERIEVAGGRELPVHLALYAPPRTGSRVQGFAAWMLLYDGEAVESPVLAQLSAALGLAVRGTIPMTLAMVWGRILPAEQASAEASAHAWLARSYAEYRRVCLQDETASEARAGAPRAASSGSGA